jgi:hypothetical protein
MSETVYQLTLVCECEGGKPGTAYTDAAGVAQVRRNDSICPTCWGYYRVTAVRTATAEEVAANPLQPVEGTPSE